MNLEKNIQGLKDEKNLARELGLIDQISEESGHIQMLADWINGEFCDVTPAVMEACEELADAHCECGGYGYNSFEDSDDVRRFIVVEVCKCVEDQIELTR